MRSGVSGPQRDSRSSPRIKTPCVRGPATNGMRTPVLVVGVNSASRSGCDATSLWLNVRTTARRSWSACAQRRNFASVHLDPTRRGGRCPPTARIVIDWPASRTAIWQ